MMTGDEARVLTAFLRDVHDIGAAWGLRDSGTVVREVVHRALVAAMAPPAVAPLPEAFVEFIPPEDDAYAVWGPRGVASGSLWEVPSADGARVHRVLAGDALRRDLADVQRLMGGAVADTVVTDPPFAVYGSSTGIGIDVVDDKIVRPFFEAMFFALRGVLKDFGHCYVCCDWRTWSTVWGAAAMARMTPKNCIVWDKRWSGLGNNYGNRHEFIGYFSKIPTRKHMKDDRPGGQRAVLRPNLIECSGASGDERLINAAKPVKLLKELIVNSTEPGENVLDLFGGSGSTAVASEALGRASFTMEMEPKRVALILARLTRLGLTPRRLEDA